MITIEDAERIGRAKAGLWGTSDCMTYVEFTFSASELLAFARQVEAETIERCAKDEREAKAKAILAFASWLPRDYESAVFQAGIEQARHLAQGYTQYLLASDNAETILSTPPADQGRKEPIAACAGCGHPIEAGKDCPDCVGAQPEGRKCVCKIGGGSVTCGESFGGIEGGTCVNRTTDGDLCGHPIGCHEPEQGGS